MNPNGLTDEQIAARPQPFAGMLVYCPCTRGWDWWRPELICCNTCKLLPGEPGCPWPPPPEFRHEWKEGDRAWVLENWSGPYDPKWFLCTVMPRTIEPGLMFSDGIAYAAWCEDTPAIYIPEERRDSCYRVADGRLINARTRKAVE